MDLLLYTLVCLNPEEHDFPVICFDSGPEYDPLPVLSTELSHVLRRKEQLERQFPDCKYVIFSLLKEEKI